MMTTQRSRRAEALDLAEQLLNDIEMSGLSAMDVARKTSRLARLLDDASAMAWLGQMGVLVESAKARITVASALPVERNEAHKLVVQFQPILDKVVGSMHGYVVERYPKRCPC